ERTLAAGDFGDLAAFGMQVPAAPPLAPAPLAPAPPAPTPAANPGAAAAAPPAAAPAAPEGVDVVILKNGGRVRGRGMVDDPAGVTVFLADKTTRALKRAEIERVEYAR